jgi:Carboxypeptidase regulatory-like domain
MQKTFIRYIFPCRLLIGTYLIRSAAYAASRSFSLIVPLAGILLFAPVVSLGQGGGAIVGRVLDPAGAAIRGAKVTLKDRQSGADQAALLTATTNEEGQFRFERLSPGGYQINVSAENFNEFQSYGAGRHARRGSARA